MIFWFCEITKNIKRVQFDKKWKDLSNITESDLVKEKSICDEENFHFWNFQKFNISEVVKDLRADGICEAKIEIAVNALPDKEPLKDLYISEKMSSICKDYHLIMSLPLYVLMDIHDKSCDDEETSISFLDEENPKTKLVELIISRKETRYTAVERARATLSDQGDE